MNWPPQALSTAGQACRRTGFPAFVVFNDTPFLGISVLVSVGQSLVFLFISGKHELEAAAEFCPELLYRPGW